MRTKTGSMAKGLATLAAPALLMLLTAITAARAEVIPDLPDEYDLSAICRSPSGRGTVAINFGDQDNGDGYRLLVEPHGLRLLYDTRKTNELIGVSSAVGLADARIGPMKVTVQRRKGRIFVLEGSSLAMVAEDNGLSGGSATVRVIGDAVTDRFRMQPMEPLFFSDDFMRQPNEPGEWTYDSGRWQIQTVGIVERGANPFSLEAHPEGEALATTGYPFWSNGYYEAAVKGSPGTVVGIGSNLQDGGNGYRLQWSAGRDGALELLKVVNGQTRTLARLPGGFVPGLWYQLALTTSGGEITAEVDHQVRLQAHDTTFGAGKIGLYARGNGGHVVWFDSILVRSASVINDTFQDRVHHWHVQDGRAIGGSPDWKNYTVTARVEAAHGDLGIPLHYQDPNNTSIIQFDNRSCRIVNISGGRREILADAPVGLDHRGEHTVAAGCRDGYLWGAIDGKLVLEALEPRAGRGRSGFEPAREAGRALRSIRIQTLIPPDPTDALTTEFTEINRHPDMNSWAGPLHAWAAAHFGGEAGFWHRGALYGDTTVRIPLQGLAPGNGEFSVLLNGDGSHRNSAYELRVTIQNREIALKLLREGEAVASGRLTAPEGDGVTLSIYRRGAFIYAGIGDLFALRYRDSAPLDGYRLPATEGVAADSGDHNRLGIVVERGQGPDVPSIRVENPHVYAETFHLAPVNWRPQSGEWDVTRRWSCQPGWTWYGGRGQGYAVNWFKAPLWGNQSLDYYAAAMMHATPDAGSESWQDLNFAFCGDGVNLFSGYTLVVGGWHNSISRLYRKGVMIAENRTFHFLPSGAAHRLWYHIATTKEGGRIRVVVSVSQSPGHEDVYPLFDVHDPAPLDGGYAAFWTYDNGMMLARAVLSAQDRGVSPLLTASPTWLARFPTDAPYPGGDSVNVAALKLSPPDNAAFSTPTADRSVTTTPAISNFNPLHRAHLSTSPTQRRKPGRSTEVHRNGMGGRLVNPAPGMVGYKSNGMPPPHPQAISRWQNVGDTPVAIEGGGLSMTVEPGGELTNITYRGLAVARRLVLDVRTSEWHRVKLNTQNAQVRVLHGSSPVVEVNFHLEHPDLEPGMVVSGRETVHLLPDGTLRVEARFAPGSTFESKRLSLNLVVPSEGYEGQRLFAAAGGARRAIEVPNQPLYPIQFAIDIRQLWLPLSGIQVRPLGGSGVLEDLRYYHLGEFWYEQQAEYPYPQVSQGQPRYVGMEIRFEQRKNAAG